MKQIFWVLAAISTFTPFTAPALAADTLVEPLYTKSAKRYSGLVFDAYAEYYKDRQFEEIDKVDATELRVDLTFPILSRSQIRLSLPFYTDGDGRRMETGSSTDIDGNGGTFNFASVSYEYQFMDSTHDGIDLMGYAGVGHRTDKLETSNGDYMNHRGNNAKVGIRLSHEMSSSTSLLGDIGFLYYWDTDDLDPSGQEEVNFGHLLTSAAVIMHDRPFKPALELTYRGDLNHYNNLAIVPELIYSFEAVDLKLGLPIGLTDDADDYGVTLGLTYRM